MVPSRLGSRSRALALLAVCALWSCSSGGASQSVPRTPSDASARFTITVPASSTTSSSARKPAYVSLATQSIVITLTSVNGRPYTGSAASTAINLSTLTPGCSGSPLTCTVTVSAVVGSDVFSVVTYDAAQMSPFTTATGNVLSQATMSVAVVAGPNTVMVVLNGVAKTISATFASDPHISGSMASGYSIIGNAPYTMTLTAQDASGETIVGDGAPTFTVTSGSSAVAVSGSGNAMTVRVQSYSATRAQLTVTPSLGSAASVAITTVQELWVANEGSSTVTGYVPGTNTAIAADTISANLSAPSALAFDPNGNLWVANGNNTVTAYVPGTNIAIAGDTFPSTTSALAFDASGLLWISSGSDAVTAVAGTPPTILGGDDIFGVGYVDGLAFDTSGNLWVSDSYGARYNSVTVYVPGPGSMIGGDTISVNVPQGLAFDTSGNLWVANSGGVTAYAPGTPPSIIAADTITASLDGPYGVAFDEAGKLWVANSGNSSVTAYVPGTNAAVAADTITASLSGPHGLVFAP